MILVANDPIKKEFELKSCKLSSVYSNSGIWKVNVSLANRKYIIGFAMKPYAERWHKKVLQKDDMIAFYEVTISTPEGDVVDSRCFDSNEAALDFIKKHKKDQQKAQEVVEDTKIDNQIGFLAKYAKEDIKAENFAVAISQTIANDTDDMSVEQQKIMIAKQLDSRHDEFRMQAKKVLISVASFYLGNREIKEEDYAKYKLKLEEEGLTSLLWQLDVAKKSIYSIYTDIQLGMGNSKMYEALTQLQRLMFDMNKYQHDYLVNLEVSIKGLKTDLEQYGAIDVGTEDAEYTDMDVKKIMRGKRALLDELENFKKQRDEIKIPMSANPKLHVENDDRMGEVMKLNDGITESADEIVGGGFDGFDDEEGEKESE